ncbi:MAG: 6-phosphogluconolactonase [Acidobacteria bacterium]|nr:MAG: 6-phosphogluconolactonase [Acidobacteriota bacterium]
MSARDTGLRDDLALLVAARLEEVAIIAARVAADAIAEALAARDRALVALSGGTSPAPLFDALARRHRAGLAPPLDDPRIAWFWADERVVAPDDPRSNARLAREHLLAAVGAPVAAVHPLPPSGDPDARARSWERELARVAGADPGGAPPVFDLVHLGLGADGHTASLFPGDAAVDETARWFVPARGPAGGPARVTMTLPLLCAAREVLFFVGGADKRDALAALVARAMPEPAPPARLVRPAGRLIVAADGAAAAGLPRGEGRP